VPAETCSSFLEKFALDIKKEAVSSIKGMVCDDDIHDDDR